MSTREARGLGDDDDAFAVLGVSRDCTLSELKQVYRLLARRYHPDVNPSPEAAAQMCRINLAFDRALEQITIPAYTNVAPATVEAGRKPSPRAAHVGAHGVPPGPRPARPRQAAWPHRAASAKNASVRVAAKIAGLAHRPHWRSGSASGRVRVRVRVRTVWLAAAASAGLATLVILAAFHALTVPGSGVSGTQTLTPLGLRPGATTTITWQDTGSVAISERPLAQLAPGQHLNEAPQWSPDGAYVALSVAPGGGAVAAGSNIVVFENGRRLTTLPGTSSRWSPRADQLAVIAGPGPSGGHPLEIVSPAANERPAPAVLDPGAGTHLAWSDDGSQIAYSANAQQQIRLASVAQGSVEALVNAPAGQHLIPVGWAAGQVVSILHAGASFSLVAVDPAQHHMTALGDLKPLPSGPAVAVTRGGALFVANTPDTSLTTLAWATYQQRWRVQLMGIQAIKFLGGWSFDGTWLALAPAPGADTSHICLAHVPNAGTQPPAEWPVHCLPIPGTLLGLSWEPRSDALSYVRVPQAGGGLELRELRIQTLRAGATAGASASASASAAVAAPAPSRSRVPRPSSTLIWGVALVALRRRVRAWRFFAVLGMRRREPGGVARGVTSPTDHGSAAAAYARLRIAIISEILRWPPDEGLKRMALALVQCLSRHAVVLAIGTRAQRVGGRPYPVVTVPANRSFIQPRLWMQLHRFHPRIVCYIPGSGLTTFSLLRALALRLGMNLLGRRSALALVSVQPRVHGRLHACLFWLLQPVMVIVQSEQRTRELRALGCRARTFTGAVDVEVFRPVAPDERLRLRHQWNVAPESFVVLHVGHLKANRNLGMLAALRRAFPEIVVVVAASTSTRQDVAVEQPLEQEGVRVIKTYVQHIENLYQLADCYIFPVQEACGSAELPLSVLEALACGLPVATTRFGALAELLPPGPTVRYFATLDELTACIRDYQSCRPTAQAARALALPYSWDRAALDLLDHLVTLLDTAPGAAAGAQAEPYERPRLRRNH